MDRVDFGHGLEFSSIILRNIQLIDNSFSNSHFETSDFSQSIFLRSNFSRTILDDCRFIDTQFYQTAFTDASMKNVQLIRTNFNRSNIKIEQILQSTFIFNTILPNGSFTQNKTYLRNGDVKQGIEFWNITDGNIQVETVNKRLKQMDEKVEIHAREMKRIDPKTLSHMSAEWSSGIIPSYCDIN